VATIDSTGNGTTSLVPALTPNGASSWNVAAVNTAGVNSTGVGTTVGVPVLNQNAASSWNGAAVNGAATTATVTNEAMVVDATVNDDEQTSLLQLGFRPTVSLPLDDEVCSEQESPLQLYTEDEKQRIFALSARIKEQFPVGNGKWWPNKHSLRDELQACGRVEGFKVRTEGDEFICCKARHPRAKEAALEAKKEATLPSKKRKSNSKIAGCGFSISIAKAKDQRNKPEDAPSGAYYIVNASYEHSNGCTPCAAQLVALNHSGGVYQKKLFKHDKLSTLLDIERSGGWSTRNYREFLRSYIYPELACITSAMIANIRIKVKRLVDLIDNGSATITAEHAADVFAKDDSIKSKLSLDEEADFISRSTNAREILREVLTLNSTDGQAVINYLQKLAIADPGFTYRVARDTENNPTGFIWMTGAMRRHSKSTVT
jgi:hypothetical protein